MGKAKVAIIGSGNIGTDLMYKLLQSNTLELTTMIGIDPQSEGLTRAKKEGLTILSNGMEGFKEQPELAHILIDATSATAHLSNAEMAKSLGKKMIDLTPAAIGSLVVPTVNLAAVKEDNLNLITCGGQATIPIVHAIQQVAPVEYAEIVATISSKSAGPGTRANIDEFTETTANGLVEIGGAKKGKAIILLNPADPPILMRNTIYALINREDEADAIIDSIDRMVAQIQQYVPGYRLRSKPLIEGKQVTVFVEVEGAGDYLPEYAGNLDIITSAAVRVAEQLAEKMTTVH